MNWSKPIKNIDTDTRTPDKNKSINKEEKNKKNSPSKSRMLNIKVFV